MPTSGKGVKPPRRTQEERSARTRIRLLDAAIECLVEYGYAGTTTPRVAERAGLTRGAQVHHFGSKTDLVVAAIKHLAQRRIESAILDVGRLMASEEPAGQILDFIWDVHQGPLFVATAELWLAARTDDTLAAEMAKVEPAVNTALLVAIAQTTPDESAQREIRDFVYTAMDALHGILISSFVDRDEERTQRRWRRACANLREIGPDLKEQG
ncbi:MAG: putative transcriptional regulator [Mycobacterium sp.]|nr:putative transcriptional regulator [Mycobacterium sp.]